MKSENIFPVSHLTLQRRDREKLLAQRGVVVWMTGLSGSGKSTLAIALERELYRRGVLCRVLDGDNVRCGINSNLGFSEADRNENIRRIAEVCRLFVDTGVVVIAAFITPSEALRQMAAGIVGKESFVEVYVSTPVEECERRDVKGLYAKARRGEITGFTGVSAPFEKPCNATLAIDTSQVTVDVAVERLLQCVMPRISGDGSDGKYDK